MLGGTNLTYFLDIPGTEAGNAGRSVRGPDLKLGYGRWSHSCGVLTNPGDGNDQVVIVTSGRGDEYLQSTEMLVVGSGQGWTKGPDLPVHLQTSTAVPTSDGKALLIVGGLDEYIAKMKTIYKLAFDTGDNQWKWTKLAQELKTGRDDSVAMILPESFC